MIALALLGTVAQIVPLTPVPSPTPSSAPATRSPIDWQALPPLPYRRTPRPTPPMTSFVLAEMKRTGCPRPAAVAGRAELRVDVAVLIGGEGLVRATIPRAIDCPTVEQYAAGLVVSFARGNLVPRFVTDGGWYRASMVFDWAE